jgi:histidinol phosphatase-like PHP family hydrolase
MAGALKPEPILIGMPLPANAIIAELLARESERIEDPTRRRALRRAGRAALTWTREAAEIAAGGESLTSLPRVGPWIAHEIERLASSTSDAEPAPLRRGFQTWTEAIPAAAAFPGKVLTDLQTHTSWSDGHSSMTEMAEAAKARGYEYLAVTDHSVGLPIAHGLSEQRFVEQWQELEQVSAETGLPLVRGIEMNLDPEANGDMPESALTKMELILGAFHSALRLKEDQTERYLAALRNPWVDVLAHPRCRMYNRRLGLSADWPRVFEEALRLDKAIEVDGYADRQDIDLDLLRIAAGSGVRISLGSDAHHVVDLDYMTFAVGAVVRAGVHAERVINCLPMEELTAWARAHRRRAPTPR